MEKKTKLYDHSGQPLPSTDDGEKGNIPPGVQALIETRINSAIDDLRERNRDDLKDLSRDHAKKWRFLAIVSSVIVIITLFYAPHQVITWIGEQIDKKLTEPMLRSSADRLIETKMAGYVSDKLKPLNKEAAELKSTIDVMNKQISDKQSMLEEGQVKLSNQLHIQKLAIASKAGSRKAYSELLEMRINGANGNGLIAASLKEIELFYDADRHQLSYPVLVKKETMKDPGYAVDEVFYVLHNSPNFVEAAINTLSRQKSEAAIAELCKIVFNTKDLRAAARATRAIEIITDEKIRPLDFIKVEVWWEQNKDNNKFLGNYDGYCEVVSRMWQRPINNSRLVDFINSLSETIDSDPNALHSMCLKAGFLMMSDDFDSAKNILNAIKQIKNDYYWLYVWEAPYKINEGDIEGAIASVNSAFKKSPTSDVINTIKYWKIFEPIKEDPQIDWPRKEERDAQPAASGDGA
jgi:tetratricopeptide (TPR) repeat protein